MLQQGDIKAVILILTHFLMLLAFLSNHNDYKLRYLFSEALDKGKTKQKKKKNTVSISELKEAKSEFTLK